MSVFTCPSDTQCSDAQALTIQMAAVFLPRFLVAPQYLAVNIDLVFFQSFLTLPGTFPKVFFKCPGIYVLKYTAESVVGRDAIGQRDKLAQKSLFSAPYSAISSKSSAPLITAHRDITKWNGNV
ncbi:MAG: hypothetical protein R2825_06800 [Saprospiraceae bacterium]